MRRCCVLVLALLSLMRADTNAQFHSDSINQTGQSDSTRARAAERRASSITGRIFSDSAQPILNASVRVVEIGKSKPAMRSSGTDGEGRFRVEDLPRGIYSIIPEAPGYVADYEALRQRPHRPGDNVNITLIKGGVITGSVTDSSSEPKVAIRVRAMLVRDKEGRNVPGNFAFEGQTDDRGIYRIYGIQTGSYLIQASDRSPNYASAISNEVPTYYPSSTLDTATPVSVRTGEEITGIDIRYRGERGHAISGNVSSADSTASKNRSTYLLLAHDPSDMLEGQTYSGARGGKDRSFAFYGVPDGDYYIFARSDSNEKGEVQASARVRVKVKGADVTGLEIKLSPLGSISGSVKFEPLPQADQKSKCETKQPVLLDEILITTRRDEKDSRSEFVSDRFSRYPTAPTEKGEFTISNIEPGSYRFGYDLPGEQLYVRSITLPPPSPTKPATDAARNSIAVKSGERVSGLTITIAEGAASVKGKVVSASEEARAPDRLRVHMVPAEKESANDALRFAEAIALGDGSFSISNLAPGRYWIIARAITDTETSARLRPLSWDAQTRAALRQEAETANVSLELQACQRISDYSLKYVSPIRPATKKSE